MVLMYTDGASLGNPGPGGYGVVLISPEHQLRKELSQGYRLTTNNRMELLAVIVGLEALKKEGTEVVVFSDSEYVINPAKKGWLANWQKKGFKGKKNADLWKRFLEVYKKHKVRFEWVKGHSGIQENERSHKLAVKAAKTEPLLIDDGFENPAY
ncbi:MAG: ribonuclease HI [Cytophagales bacterium]|nr:ribonuclease HI [Cytophagales bacterium]MDW8383177.1 ribonuclease HI [Flammeovirgaceae bacterium]